MRQIAFYASSHGHGHARRSALVLQWWLEQEPDLCACIRTNAPSEIFARVPRSGIEPVSPYFDAGAIETEILRIDPAATVGHLRAVLRRRDATIASELDWLRSTTVRLIVADIPFLAGELAAAAGIPCVALSNFTWDWIFEPFLAERADGTEILHRIRESYRKMEMLLKLPLGPSNPLFTSQMEVPYISQISGRTREEILSCLTSREEPPLARVLVGMRSGVPDALLAQAAAHNPEFEFFYPGWTDLRLPRNTRSFSEWPQLRFPDFMRACDVVVAKLGFGVISDAIGAPTRLLFPPRENFREDLWSEKEAREVLTLTAIPKADFLAGNWKPHLEKILAMPLAANRTRTNGASVAAKILARRLASEVN